MSGCQVEEHAPKRLAGVDQLQCLLAEIESVDRDVDVVTAPRRVQSARDISVAAIRGNLALQVEEQVLYAAVVLGAANRIEVEALDGVEYRARVAVADDPALCQHDGMCAIDGDIVIQEVALRIGETVREHVVLVALCRKLFAHRDSAAGRLTRLANRRYAPGTPAGSCRNHE